MGEVGIVFHIIAEIFIIAIIALFIIKKEFILKHYRRILVICLVLALPLELAVYINAIAKGEFIRILPLGMCHLSVYITTLIVYRYNKQLHILAFLIIGGSLISLIALAPIYGRSIISVRPYYFIFIHLYIILVNIMLAYKHELVISRKEYFKSIMIILGLVTLSIFISLLTKQDEMFFFGGPEGTPLDKISFGLFRAVGAYVVYYLLYSASYFTLNAYRKRMRRGK